MKVWYRARFGEIKPVSVEKSTEKSVVLSSGRREPLDSDWTWYRASAQEAKQAMIDYHKGEVAKAKQQVAYEEERLSKATNARIPIE